jgi:hypothetical protein
VQDIKAGRSPYGGYIDTPLGRKTRDEIIAELQDAGIDYGQNDPVNVYVTITSGRSFPGVKTPSPPPTLTGVPSQTGPWTFAPTRCGVTKCASWARRHAAGDTSPAAAAQCVHLSDIATGLDFAQRVDRNARASDQ